MNPTILIRFGDFFVTTSTYELGLNQQSSHVVRNLFILRLISSHVILGVRKSFILPLVSIRPKI